MSGAGCPPPTGMPCLNGTKEFAVKTDQTETVAHTGTTPESKVTSPTDITVLIVDDDRSVLKALRRSLADENYRILTTDSTREAIDLLATNRVAVVISDFKMPGMSGADLLAYVEARHPQCIRIMLSGASDTEAVPDSVADGILHCQRFITKPWNDISLAASIRECVAQYTNFSLEASVSSTQRDKPEAGNIETDQRTVCRNCQATLEPTWVACPHCGEQ